jgi:hypothetical protein
VEQSEQFRTSLRQARRGDEEVRKKWDQWAPLINVLAGGEVGRMVRSSSVICLTLLDRRYRKL